MSRIRLLQANNILFSFGKRILFNIDKLEIYEGDRIGLVGLNGSGKTTLLRLISGEITPERGTFSRSGTISYFEQLSDHIQHTAENKELGLFGVCDISKRDSVSGGENTRLRLADMFSQDSTLYLIDEPTSHLDEQGVAYLNHRLFEINSFVLVSHDRELLDKQCNRIIEIENGELHSFYGNYSDYVVQKQQAFERASFEYNQYVEEKDRLTEAYQDKKAKAKKVAKKPHGKTASELKAMEFGTVGRSLQSRSKSLERSANNIKKRIEHMDVKEKPKEIPLIRPKFELTDPPQNRIIMEAENLSFSYSDGTEIFKNATFRLTRGSRTVLSGENGSGKTTLIRLILEGEKVRIVPKARIGYLQQNLSNLCSKHTVLESAMENSIQSVSVVRSLLARLLFKADDMDKTVSVLSGGERIRLSFVRIFVSNANVLVLDEPTNYLDIPSVEAIQKLLSEYEGTMLFVSHDRTFVKAIATEELIIRDKQIFRESSEHI